MSDTIKSKGVRGLYSGSGALIAGNGLKAGVRFMTYDAVKDVFRGSDVSSLIQPLCMQHGICTFADYQGKLSTTGSMLSGLAAGVVEAMVAVTPSETIKCVSIIFRSLEVASANALEPN